jgi:hypothetical protein
MEGANPLRKGTVELLGTTWQVWCSHAGMFVLLMGISVATLGLFSLTVNYLVLPHADGTPLIDIWRGASFLQKFAVFVAFLGSLAMQYRVLAASSYSTQEIRNGRSVGILRAVGSVRRKQLRLFWIGMLASPLTGPLGLILCPILALVSAPAFPVAILENMTAFAAIKRGNRLAKGEHGKIALLVALWGGLFVAAVVGWLSFLVRLEERFGRPWFLRPVPILGFWLILLIPQACMISLTLNYLDQRGREEELRTAIGAQVSS